MRTYVELVRVPGVLNLTASQLFARLPLGMLSLAILLHVQNRTGSYAIAGAAVACVSVGEALAMPATARLTGRLGMVAVLSTAAVINGASMLALAFASSAPWVMMVLGLLIGASVPPLMPVVRALYPQLVSRDGVRALFALDTTAQELIWVIGPVLATFLASAVATSIPLVASAAITIGGTIWFLVSARRLRPRIAKNTTRFGTVLANRAVILAMVASLALVASFLALEVGIVAGMGSAGVTAGAAIAVASVGSLVGGLVFGHRRFGLLGLLSALLVVSVGTTLYGIVDGLPLQFAALFLSGLGFAPALSALYFMVSSQIDERSATEAFGWLNSAALVGGAIGTAIAGIATDSHGPSGAVVVSVTLSVIAAGSPLIARLAGPLHGLTRESPADADDALCSSANR